MKTTTAMMLLAMTLASSVAHAEDLPIFDSKTKKPADQIKVNVEKDTASFDVFSPSGIGGATIMLTKGKWPTTVILRLHLSGLESLAVSNGKMKLTGAVLTKRLHLTEDGKERKPCPIPKGYARRRQRSPTS